MSKPELDVKQLADQYGKSLVGETKNFEQFLIDYFQLNPQEAFKNLKESGVNSKTQHCAEMFHHEYLDKSLERIQDDIQGMGVNPASRQGKIIQEFYKDYFIKNDFSSAWENAQTKINQDPELRTDEKFKAKFKEHAEKLKPEQKTGRIEVDFQEDQDLFFKIRLGQKKKFMNKLSDFETKKVMEDCLKEFYTAQLPPHLDKEAEKRKIDVAHEIDAVYDRGRIPLAVHLAHADTKKITERTTSELRDLDRNSKLVRDMSFQGVKFKFTDKDLKDSVKKASADQRSLTGTEKVDIVRELIIDLRTHSVNESFKDAIRKTTQLGDNELLKVLQKNFPLITNENSNSTWSSLLSDTYSLYVKKDITKYKADVLAETEKLSKGIKIEAIRVAIDEIKKKSEAFLVSRAYNKFYQKAIHSISPQEKTKFQRNTLEEDVLEVARKTGIKVNMDHAKTQPSTSNEQGKERNIDMGAHLN